MEIAIGLIPFIGGIYFIGVSFMLETPNMKSTVILQIIPFLCGLGCMFSGAKILNWL